MGRWVNRDPIGEEGGGLNLYGFTQNGPVNLVDLYGLTPGVRCDMDLSPDWTTPYGSEANMVCSYDCCRCKQVRFKQQVMSSLVYFLFGFPKFDIRPWQPDHEGPYYETGYLFVPCLGDSGRGWASMGDRPGFTETFSTKLGSLLQMFRTEAICVEGLDAGTTYAIWEWGHYFDPPVSDRWWSPQGAVGF